MMIVHYTFTIHPDRREPVKDELRRLRSVVEKHGGRGFRYYASMTSGTPNRSFAYEIENFAHFDALNADPEFHAVRLDALFTGAAQTVWGDVAL
jgi:quinol monooxygenase YgiN